MCRDGSGRCEQLAKKVQEKLDEFKAGKRDLGQVAYECGYKILLFLPVSSRDQSSHQS